MEKIKLFSMFTGYGGCCWGLKKANVNYECVGYSETDKYAIQCFNQNFPNIKNYGDCKLINPKELPDFDLLTGGFPCQDVSIAGKRDLRKGRTMLINDIFRILVVKKPKYVILENVKGLLSASNGDLFRSIIYTLKELGYGVAYKVLNSKHYGIPQNRERIWIVCKYGGWNFMEFQYPLKEELKIFVKDILQKEVDNKYYLSENAIKRLINNQEGYHSKIDPDIASCLFSSQHKISRGMDMIQIADFRNDEGLRIRKDNCSPCLGTRGGLGRTPIVSHSLFPRTSTTNQGGTGHLSKTDGTSYAIDTGNCQAIELNKKIRRLTPKECFRLMGFLKDEINLDNLSDTQCYKLAGNGWDINVASKIFKNLLRG